MEIIRYGETCNVKQANSSKEASAVVFATLALENAALAVSKAAVAYVPVAALLAVLKAA